MAIFGEKMAKIGLIDKSRWALQGILQKSMGYENYLFILSVFKVFLFKWYRREADFNFFLDLLNESDVVLDVGASLGVTTTLISRRVRTGVVYAFEPIPLSYNNLERLIRFFKCSNVRCFNLALGHRNGKTEMLTPILHSAVMTGLSHIHDENRRNTNYQRFLRFSVEEARLDRISMLEDIKIDYMKVDVENYERFVFLGGIHLIKKNKPVILCEIWDPVSRDQAFELLSGMGYRMMVLEKGELIEFHPDLKKNYLNYFFNHD